MRAALLAAAASLLALGAREAGEPGARHAGAHRAADSVPWRIGERLEYGVKFGLFTVGRGTLEVLGVDTVRGEATYHIVFTIRGRALMYSLNDSMQSWFGVRDMVSRRFIQDNEENGRLRYRRYEIFPERGLWVRNDSDTGATVQDPLDDASFFFFARTLPMEPGRTYSFERYFIRDRNPVILRVLGRQTIGVPAGRFRTVLVQPIFKSRGLFGQGGQAIIWFSDDAARIPVRMRSSLPVGTIDISLRARW